MITLTLVIGAGASNEVKLPVGSELKLQIADSLDIRYGSGGELVAGDYTIAEAIRYLGSLGTAEHGDARALQRSCWKVRDGMPLCTSIDSFIDSHRADQSFAIVGKLGIARALLRAEGQSSLYFDEMNGDASIPFRTVSATWFAQFFQLLVDGGDFRQAKERMSRVAVVSFNYDRCLEHFLFHGLQKYFPDISANDAAEAIRLIKIYHPYGTVGALPWMEHAQKTPFGQKPSPKDLIAIANQIRTYNEGMDPSLSDITSIQALLPNSERVLFLGFAFHKINVDLLLPDDGIQRQERTKFAYATALGLSQSDIGIVTDELSNRLKIPHLSAKL